VNGNFPASGNPDAPRLYTRQHQHSQHAMEYGNAPTAGCAMTTAFCCRFSCRLTPTLSGIARGERRQITLSVNDLQFSCRTSYTPSIA
jgi:hypothetical protein